MLDIVMIPLIIAGLIAAFWHNTGWKLFQSAIACAVLESQYFWHWAPPSSILPLACGIALAVLLTALWADFQKWMALPRAHRFGLLRRVLRQPWSLLSSDNRR